MSTIKIKESTVGGEYLTSIPQVQLNQSFGTSLNNALQQIDANFKKITSLPFLQGDHGNSIFEVTVKIGDGDIGNALKEAICQCIYGTTSPDDSNFGGTQPFGESWDPATYDGTEIVFYRHKETNENGEMYYYTAREFFIFIDCRINSLGENNLNLSPSVLTSFVDLSCAVTITASAPARTDSGQPDLTSITFTAKKHSIVPTLYYNGSSTGSTGHWCWMVNGTRTGVIAQGVQGTEGISKSIYVCKGQKIPQTQHNNSIIKITNILQPESLSGLLDYQIPGRISEGDLIVVWFRDEDQGAFYNSLIDNCTFGIAKNHSSVDPNTNTVIGYTYIDNSTVDGQRTDLATIMCDLSLYRWLNDINGTEAHTDQNRNPLIRGLYIPDGEMNASSSDVHMLWSDGGKTASLGCVGMNNREKESASLPTNSDGSVSGWTEDNSQLTLWYPTIRCHKGTSYRKLPAGYELTGGMPVNAVPIKFFGGSGTSASSTTLGRSGDIVSAISLKGNLENVEEEALLSSTGLYIKRNGSSYNAHASDIPSVYIDQGTYGKMYIKKGTITVEDGNIYLGSSALSYTMPQIHFDAKYDGSNTSASDGGSYTQAIEDSVKTNRWSFGPNNNGSNPPFITNPGIKLVKSDAIVHDGTVIVSSSNAYKSVFVRDNKLMFDYKVHAEIGSLTGTGANAVSNSTAVHDRRPRYPQYMGIVIGGYNTIYNSVTKNSDSSGKAISSLDNIRDPIVLTPAENKEYAFMSGKSGYTSMIENHGVDKIRTIDPPYQLNDLDNSSPSVKPGLWGLLTSYDCIWTKIGNVVDVKGKIFVNKVQYIVPETTGGQKTISVTPGTAVPITYAELFRHLKKYGTQWAFPLPLVVERTSETPNAPNGSTKYVVSTGNVLDNSQSGNNVNSNRLDYQHSTTTDYQWPKTGLQSINEYHNNLFNGSAQFHFYGTEFDRSSNGDFFNYGSTLDNAAASPVKGLTNGKIGPDGQNLDMLNNVFTVTADISKSPTYDDRYWCMSAIPNYDVLNYRGYLQSEISRDKYDQFDLNSSENGPVRIVSYESPTGKTDTDAPATGSRYHQSHAILGLFGVPNCYITGGNGSMEYKYRRPQKFYQPAGHLTNVKRNTYDGANHAGIEGYPYGEGQSYAVYHGDHSYSIDFGDSSITGEHLGGYLAANFVKNLNSYKISVNIGSYKIRYITFAFSYLLDDDVQQNYAVNENNRYQRTNRNESVDSDQWVMPSSGTGNHHTYTAEDWLVRSTDVTELAEHATHEDLAVQ